MSPLVPVAAAGAVAAALLPGGAAAGAGPVSVQRYLSTIAWPVRASVFRAAAVTDRIDGWFTYGDPPFLGGIAGSCRSLSAVEPDSRGRLLRIAAPPGLRTGHLPPRLFGGTSCLRQRQGGGTRLSSRR